MKYCEKLNSRSRVKYSDDDADYWGWYAVLEYKVTYKTIFRNKKTIWVAAAVHSLADRGQTLSGEAKKMVLNRRALTLKRRNEKLKFERDISNQFCKCD